MYVCMCVCVCVCMYVCMYVICVCMYVSCFPNDPARPLGCCSLTDAKSPPSLHTLVDDVLQHKALPELY